jgi:hypothetical protein
VCPKCQRPCTVADDVIGRLVSCPVCATPFEARTGPPPKLAASGVHWVLLIIWVGIVLLGAVGLGVTGPRGEPAIMPPIWAGVLILAGYAVIRAVDGILH